jgi:formylglycine-generating enzyme required for sulfatase activity
VTLARRGEARSARVGQLRSGYRHTERMDGFGFRFDEPDFSVISDFSSPRTEVVPSTSSISGELSVKFKLEPSISFLVYGSAGGKVALSAGGGFVAETDPTHGLEGRWEANLDLKIEPDGWAFKLLKPKPSFSWTLWENRWHLFPDDAAGAPPLAILDQPDDTAVRAGGTAQFSCAANRSSGARYQWYGPGGVLPGQNGATLELTNVTEDLEGRYKARVQAAGETLWSDEATLSVQNNLADVATRFQYPIEKTPSSEWHVAQEFAEFNSGYNGLHAGEDWSLSGSADVGKKVCPVAPGKVVKIVQTSSSSIRKWGWTVVVEHTLAKSARRPGDAMIYYSVYSHVSPNTDGTLTENPADKKLFPYQVGASVPAGKPLGYIGAITAPPPAGPHLHLEIRRWVRDITAASALYTLGAWSAGYAATRADLDAEGLLDPSDFIDAHGAVNNPSTDDFVLIPGGTFRMGDSFGEGEPDELPVHDVYVSGFHMGKYEVTKALWDEVRAWGRRHGYRDLPAGNGKAADHPVCSVNWYDVVKWCNARSEKDGLTPCYRVSGSLYRTGNRNDVACDWNANGYRVPTDAEWEKAARGGLKDRRFPWGDTISHARANYRSIGSYDFDLGPTAGYHPDWNDGQTPYTSPVGSFAPNGFELYDMAGNVWEWCWDWWDPQYYVNSPGKDPVGPATSTGSHCFRSSSWGDEWGTWGARCADRSRMEPDGSWLITIMGFRVVRGSVL